ncbi:hypothetical protein QYM36_004362 [Artemia franciscana]|uniref:Uncharacterized protein n=1 Tax=Artemia franciscana TaxID=6661 RepID=A0AA88LBU7_ARTSF|nr:hypothetical protein QYM36_004362 [Artemia franciscana]
MKLLEKHVSVLKNESERILEILSLERQPKDLSDKRENRCDRPCAAFLTQYHDKRSYSDTVEGHEKSWMTLEPLNKDKKPHFKAETLNRDTSNLISTDSKKFSAKSISNVRNRKIILEMSTKPDRDCAMSTFSENEDLTKLKQKKNNKKTLSEDDLLQISKFVSNDECWSSVLDSNPSIYRLVSDGETLKVISSKRYTDSDFGNLIIEVSTGVRGEIIAQGGIKCSFLLFHCANYVHLKWCSKCCLYGHMKSQCRCSEKCSQCTEDHPYGNCTKPFSSKLSSHACVKANIRYQPHAAYGHVKSTTCQGYYGKAEIKPYADNVCVKITAKRHEQPSSIIVGLPIDVIIKRQGDPDLLNSESDNFNIEREGPNREIEDLSGINDEVELDESGKKG